MALQGAGGRAWRYQLHLLRISCGGGLPAKKVTRADLHSARLVNNQQHIGFVLDRRRDEAKPEHTEDDTSAAEDGEPEESNSISTAKEVGHD